MTPQPRQVLVVDDDASIRTLTRMALEDAGYVVDEASDGAPALQRLHTSAQPVVVLLDLRMPGMDGRQVMEAVTAHETLATRHAFVLVTANAHTLPPSLATALTHLNTPVLAKPFDLETLLQAVAQAAERIMVDNVDGEKGAADVNS